MKHLTAGTDQQFYLSSQQMLQNSTCRIYDSLLKCNLRSHYFFRETMVPREGEGGGERENVDYNADRNILAYHFKKIQCIKKRPRSSVGRMSHHPTQNLQHFKLPPTLPYPLQQCTLSQQTLPFCQL